MVERNAGDRFWVAVEWWKSVSIGGELFGSVAGGVVFPPFLRCCCCWYWENKLSKITGMALTYLRMFYSWNYPKYAPPYLDLSSGNKTKDLKTQYLCGPAMISGLLMKPCSISTERQKPLPMCSTTLWNTRRAVGEWDLRSQNIRIVCGWIYSITGSEYPEKNWQRFSAAL